MLGSALCPAASSLGRLRAERVLVKVCAAPSLLLRRPLSTPTTISTSPATHEGPATVSTETITPRPLQRFSTQEIATAECETLPILGRHADTKRGVEGVENQKGSKDIVATQTATWIHLGGLPPETNRVDIIRAMLAAGPTGRVLAVTLTPPGSTPRAHPEFAVASVEFGTVEEAQRLLDYARRGIFTVRGKNPFVKMQVKKCRPEPGRALGPGGQPRDGSKPKTPQTRVLVLRGRTIDPRMQVSALRAFFQRHEVPPEVENIEVRDYSATGARNIIWRFCSWRYQARRALKLLREDFGKNSEGRFKPIGIFYGHDPCDVGETKTEAYPKENVQYRSIF